MNKHISTIPTPLMYRLMRLGMIALAWTSMLLMTSQKGFAQENEEKEQKAIFTYFPSFLVGTEFIGAGFTQGINEGQKRYRGVVGLTLFMGFALEVPIAPSVSLLGGSLFNIGTLGALYHEGNRTGSDASFYTSLNFYSAFLFTVSGDYFFRRIGPTVSFGIAGIPGEVPIAGLRFPVEVGLMTNFLRNLFMSLSYRYSPALIRGEVIHGHGIGIRFHYALPIAP